MLCPACGLNAPPRASTCPECGTVLTRQPASARDAGVTGVVDSLDDFSDAQVTGVYVPTPAGADSQATSFTPSFNQADVEMTGVVLPLMPGTPPPAPSAGRRQTGVRDTKTRTPGNGGGVAQGPLQPGEEFGPRYHIMRLLGAGGMGAVYQAWDADLEMAVAIKVILPAEDGDQTAAADLERRFKRELVLARQVTHKNVVRIHDLGEID